MYFNLSDDEIRLLNKSQSSEELTVEEREVYVAILQKISDDLYRNLPEELKSEIRNFISNSLSQIDEENHTDYLKGILTGLYWTGILFENIPPIYSNHYTEFMAYYSSCLAIHINTEIGGIIDEKRTNLENLLKLNIERKDEAGDV